MNNHSLVKGFVRKLCLSEAEDMLGCSDHGKSATKLALVSLYTVMVMHAFVCGQCYCRDISAQSWSDNVATARMICFNISGGIPMLRMLARLAQVLWKVHRKDSP